MKEDIKIEVFNGSGKQGMAKEVTDFLREQGFDVVSWGNEEQSYAKTLIVDRTGSIAYANLVGEALRKNNIISRVDMSKMVDVSLYIGKDLKALR